ncbi:hypothetical protein FVA74_06525 [Salinibacterium sp. dk2585]|uniref:PH-like domain-containing protein n=1 Tax=unclassified Salinibacterium TaxID=2632331 RepID=UPI0011C24B36|nr:MULTISPECIES: hypothetical protein [unclassified Salinibacterium]QEE61273.1 hypothetical protein FVA74_06525 [Salinibacterium sp. dk2585]TXK53949.1 hypothetical protein FVP63_07975 [Salinibacterium sp. dk5596]
MDKNSLMAIVVALMIILPALMALGWHNRRRRQSSIPAPRRLDAALVDASFAADVFYVATTVAGEPLERIAVGGLGFRARASIAANGEGVALTIPGQAPAWIPAEEIVGIDRATWTIDRVVEPDGLVLLAWRLVADSGESTPVDSYLRFDLPTLAADFIAAVTELINQSSPSSAQGGTA